ncbi:tetratricopeptide repeat protein [Persicimonas caeni]|uniref:Tetratricopeptide repeat protein n=1 Tax=Persicimonas caeni TaxID=2292766 RepID=A0A4Y6Q279_PERCE|nr:tetratricopeptide repeat protein [Persicimonas caeni]QDG54579.1 tetratricopeptide repeat protein [Persicimonas caeni]QED35800.1 tetratricopeptide repeat protein [Persicimonas caeni]
MNCAYCGYFNEEPTEICGRCGADIPEPSCGQCGVDVDWGDALCEQCEKLTRSADKTPCPSCSAFNTVSAEYCTTCGTPMAVITRVMTLSRAKDREPLETWRVYGIETSMVGRDDEMARLEGWLEEATEESSVRVVGLTGSTGLGKSRLVAEFNRTLDKSFSEAVFVQAASRDESGGPYSMFGRLLKNRFYIGEKDHPDSARRKLLEAVDAIVADDDEAERIGHLVGHLIGMQFEDSPYVPDIRDSEGAYQLDQRSFDAVLDLLAADAAQNPLVIALEDLQYATTQSGALIDYLTKNLVEHPVLFVLSWNPDEVFMEDVLDEMPIDELIELKPLSDREVRDFVRDTLHKADEIPEALVEKIVDAAHGNPLSVEEMLRILISQGVIDTREQTWRVGAERIDEVDLPTTVEATVRARLATLADDERRVLEMAACIGDAFWSELVRCLYRMHVDHEEHLQEFWSDDEIDGRVDELIESLERKDMVRRRDDTLIAPYEELYFKHRIERVAVYEDIPAQDKQRYHRMIAQWLEREASDDGEVRLAEMVARHFDEARCLEHAAGHYLHAAHRAARHYANRKAVKLYTKGLAYLSDADIDLKLEAFHDLGSVYDLLGEYDQSLAYFREMLRYSWLVDDIAKGGAAYNKIGRAYRSMGEYDEALEAFEKALVLFRDADDTRGVASTLDDIGQIKWVRGHYDAALKYYSAGLQLRRELGDERSVALSLNHIGTVRLARGELKEAMVYYREALELRKEIGDRQGVADSFNNLAALCLERGENAKAIALFREALQRGRSIGYRSLEMVVLNNLGETYLKDEELEAAQACLDEAMEVAEESGDKRVLFDVLRNLAALAVENGERKLALERIDEALALADQLDSTALHGIGKHSLAEIHARYVDHPTHGDEAKDKAPACFDEAIDVLEDVGNESQLARCLSSYGEYLAGRGDASDARQKLERARDIFTRLEMPKQREAVDLKLDGLKGAGEPEPA